MEIHTAQLASTATRGTRIRASITLGDGRKVQRTIAYDYEVNSHLKAARILAEAVGLVINDPVAAEGNAEGSRRIYRARARDQRPARQYRLEDLPDEAQARVAEARGMVGQIHDGFLAYDPNLRPLIDPLAALLVSLVTRAEYAEARLDELERTS